MTADLLYCTLLYCTIPTILPKRFQRNQQFKRFLGAVGNFQICFNLSSATTCTTYGPLYCTVLRCTVLYCLDCTVLFCIYNFGITLDKVQTAHCIARDMLGVLGIFLSLFPHSFVHSLPISSTIHSNSCNKETNQKRGHCQIICIVFWQKWGGEGFQRYDSKTGSLIRSSRTTKTIQTWQIVNFLQVTQWLIPGGFKHNLLLVHYPQHHRLC